MERAMKHYSRLLWQFVVFIGSSAMVSAADNFPPAVINVSPMPGTIYALTNITVTFSEPVIGVSFSDLLINGTPALEVSGSGAVYTFVLEQPSYGVVQITWDPDHAIVDLDEPAKR